MVGRRDVQHRRLADRMLLVQQTVDADTIIADKGVAIGAACGHEGDAAAQAITNQPDFAAAGRLARCLDGRFQIANALILVEFGDEAQGLVHLFGNVGIQFDMGFDPPEQVGGIGDIAGLRPGIGFPANALIHPEDFLNNDDRGGRLALGLCHIGIELRIAFQRADGSELAHTHSFR